MQKKLRIRKEVTSYRHTGKVATLFIRNPIATEDREALRVFHRLSKVLARAGFTEREMQLVVIRMNQQHPDSPLCPLMQNPSGGRQFGGVDMMWSYVNWLDREYQRKDAR